MKKILFYTQNRWAFGSIHHGLCKELYKHNIYANVLDWTVNYTEEEFNHLNRVYDVFVTNPEAVLNLHRRFKIPLKKIISIAHAQWDILLAKHESVIDFFSELNAFAVISNTLKEKCIEWKISCIPKVVELGIHFDTFYELPANSLKIIGYGGSNETYNFYGKEIKRPKLVERIVNELECFTLKKHAFYNHLCMPSYYKDIDCVIMSSIEEAGGLPMMECAAAGRLPIGTPVGYFKENGPKGGGIVVPLEEEAFINKTKDTLFFYQKNPTIYKIKCQQIQQFAYDNYDWSKKILPWVELLT